MGKTRIIAETGAGQHGVATATVAARLGWSASSTWAPRTSRQAPNVYRMRLLGAEVVAVTSGSRTLKDALNEAMRDWVTNVDNTFYIIGTVAGPHPYPAMVRDFQAVIGREARAQMLERTGAARCPGRLRGRRLQCHRPVPSLPRPTKSPCTASRPPAMAWRPGAMPRPCAPASPGVLHGNRTYLMEDADGQIIETHSVSAGLDYPGVGPEHAWLKDTGRARYVSVTDEQALQAFHDLTRIEGIIPALESSHAWPMSPSWPRPCARPEHRRQPVRPWRQGHQHRRETGGHRGMSRIAGRFAELRAAGRKALIPFVTAGDPEPGVTVPLMHALVGGGRRYPRAGRALLRSHGRWPGDPGRLRAGPGHHTSLRRVLEMVREFRTRDADTRWC
jgi:hypothetical protein